MPTAKELMRAGELYRGDDPELNRELDRCQVRVEALNAIPYENQQARRAALDELLAAIGEDAQIRSPFHCDFGDGIRVGARTFINVNCVMLDGASISLGGKSPTKLASTSSTWRITTRIIRSPPL